MKRNLAFEFGM